MTSRPWLEFEKLVAEIHQKASPGAEVNHNRRLVGRSGRRRQVDITISQSVGLYPALIVIECKRYKRPVSMEKVEAFASKLEDVGASQGVIVTDAGFDAGARAVAERKGITLMTYREATELDWHQATAAAAWLALTLTRNQVTQAQVNVEEAEAFDFGPQTLVREADGTPITTVEQIAIALTKELELGQRPAEHLLEMTPEPPLFVEVDQSLRRVDSLSVRCRVRTYEYIINLALGSGHILTDSATGRPRYQELISKPWDVHEMLAGPPHRELTAAEFDEIGSSRRVLAALKPENLKRYMRVVITPKTDNPGQEEGARLSDAQSPEQGRDVSS